MTSENALKACWSCATPADLINLDGRFTVRCRGKLSCPGRLSNIEEPDSQDATDAWNTRASGWEDAKRVAFEEAARVAVRASEQAGSYRQDSCLEELGDHIAAELRALAKALPSPPENSND